jgi:hypothetical protein
MWGLCGSPLASENMVWLVVAQHIIKRPRKIVEVARAELAKMAQNKTLIGTTVLPDDAVACRFAEFMGFNPISRDMAIDEAGQIPVVYRPEAQ